MNLAVLVQMLVEDLAKLRSIHGLFRNLQIKPCIVFSPFRNDRKAAILDMVPDKNLLLLLQSRRIQFAFLGHWFFYVVRFTSRFVGIKLIAFLRGTES
jgi:hypothetical protein